MGAEEGLTGVGERRRGGQRNEEAREAPLELAAAAEVGGIVTPTLLDSGDAPVNSGRLRLQLDTGKGSGGREGDGDQDGVLKWEEKGRLL